jgi:hypothetical protein
MRKWLARLAFSFIILAAWQFWEGRKARERGRDPTWHYVSAAVLLGAGMAGMRERHRPQ